MPQRKNWWKADYLEHLFLACSGHLDTTRADKIRTWIDESATLLQGDLYPSIIHGDPWANNILIANDGHTHLVDWDETGVGPALLDVAYAALFNCFPEGRYAKPLLESLLAGYFSIRPITGRERQLFALAVSRLRCTNYLWILQQHHKPGSGMASPEWLWNIETAPLTADFERISERLAQ